VLRIALISTFLLAPVSAQSNANFNLLIASPSLNVIAGSSQTLTMQVSVVAGYTQPVYLIPSSLPAGLSISLPSPVVGSQSVTLTVTASPSIKAQTVPVTIYSASSGETHSATFSIAVALPEPEKHWVASWGASAVVPSNASGAYYLTNVTVRQIAHLSLGAASSLRIRLSNALGKAAVSFASIHVAQWAGNPSNPTSAILPATDRIVTFFGSATITVAAGADIFSDPVSLPLPAGSDLAVSFYIPKTSNIPATMHTFGNQKAYFALGDSTASPVIPNAVTDTVRPYLTGVEVEASDASAVVALGDSLTDGMLWPDSLSHRLDNRLGIVNEGIAGNCLVVDCMGPNAMARFERDVLTISGVRYLIVLEGESDIGNAPELTAAQLIDAYRTMIGLAHAKGILVFGGTLPPFGGSHAGSPAHEQLRQQVNEFIRTGGAFDAVIDFDKALANPENPAVLLAAFDRDHIHPNDAGYQAMTNAIDLTLLSAR
jgi:lysophospholipase L1-like esterase